MEQLLYAGVLLITTYPFLGKKYYQIKNIRGTLLAFAIGLFAFYLGKQIPLIGGSVFGISIGILVSSWNRPSSFNPGIKITAKKGLQAAIVLIGFELNLKNVIAVGSQSLVIMLSTMTMCFLTAYFVGKKFKITSELATLIGVGTAVCGGSAIAATAPVIDAKEDQVATAISTIFLFNIIAVVLFPALGRMFSMSDTGFGLWAGTAINDTSSTVAAAFSFSETSGQLATIVKLTRTLMIIPITFVLAMYQAKKRNSKEKEFSIANVFPWFVVGFILACIINTTGLIPKDMAMFMGKFGKFLIIVAMSAIGLNTDVKALLRNGREPILLGVICWFVVSATSLIVQKLLNLI